jgi:hypothetical protein
VPTLTNAEEEIAYRVLRTHYLYYRNLLTVTILYTHIYTLNAVVIATFSLDASLPTDKKYQCQYQFIFI